MAVWQRQGTIHVQDVVLCAQEAFQVLRVRGHLLGDGIHAPPADQSLHEQQRHSLLITVHHSLEKASKEGLCRKSENCDQILLLQDVVYRVHLNDAEVADTGAATSKRTIANHVHQHIYPKFDV